MTASPECMACRNGGGALRLPGRGLGLPSPTASGRRNGGEALRLPGRGMRTRSWTGMTDSLGPQWRGSLATPRTSWSPDNSQWTYGPQWRGSLATPRTCNPDESTLTAAAVPQWRGSLATPRTPPPNCGNRSPGGCRNGGGALRLPGLGEPACGVGTRADAAMEGEPCDSPDVYTGNPRGPQHWLPQWRGSLATPRTCKTRGVP